MGLTIHTNPIQYDVVVSQYNMFMDAPEISLAWICALGFYFQVIKTFSIVDIYYYGALGPLDVFIYVFPMWNIIDGSGDCLRQFLSTL